MEIDRDVAFVSESACFVDGDTRGVHRGDLKAFLRQKHGIATLTISNCERALACLQEMRMRFEKGGRRRPEQVVVSRVSLIPHGGLLLMICPAKFAGENIRIRRLFRRRAIPDALSCLRPDLMNANTLPSSCVLKSGHPENR